MRKGWKVFWIVCATLIGAGILFCAVGAVMGGTLMGISHEYEEEWRSRYVTDDVDYTGDTTREYKEDENLTAEGASSVNLGEYAHVWKLDVKLTYINVIVKEYDGETVKVQVNGIEESLLQDINQHIDEEGTLEIELTKEKKWEKLFNNHTPGTMTILIPSGTLDEANLSVGAGVLTVEELHTDEFDMEIGAGKAIVNQLTARTMDLQCGAGEVEITADVSGESEIECGVGDVVYHAAGRQEDYNYNLDCGIGEMRIGSMEFAGIIKEQHVDNPKAERTMDVQCGIGSIEIDFAE